jgi:hypothetical protein
MKICKKITCEVWRFTFKAKNFLPLQWFSIAPIMIATCPIQAFKTKSIKEQKKISSYYNIKPLKSHISFEKILNYYYFAQIIQSMFLWDKFFLIKILSAQEIIISFF